MGVGIADEEDGPALASWGGGFQPPCEYGVVGCCQERVLETAWV